MKRRDVFKYGVAAGAACISGLGSIEAGQLSRVVQPPRRAWDQDLTLINARIMTLDPRQPEATAALVRSGRIALVGSTGNVRAEARDASVFDAGGRTVVPGFIDGHTHLEWFSYSMDYQVPLDRSIPSLAKMFEILRAKCAETPAGRWVIGRGDFGVASQVAEKRMPTRQEMDQISSDRPVALFSSIHIASLNTVAFKALGLWDAAAAADLRWRDGTRRVGTTLHRDAEGRPTGVVTEIGDLLYASGLYSDEQRRTAIRKHALQDFASKGITSIMNIPSWSDDLRAVQALHASGDLPLRVRYYPRVPMTVGLSSLVDAGMRPGAGNDMFRFGGIKLFIDGAGSDGMGRRLEDYKWTPESLAEILTHAQAAEFPAIIHVVSAGGLRLAFEAIAKAQRGSSPLGHRIDHLGFLEDPADIRRLRELGLRVGLTRASRGAGKPRVAPAYRALVDAGIEPVAVSDSAGSFSTFSPLAGIGSLVAPPSEGGVLPQGQRLTVDEAFQMWTVWAARSAFEERDKGSIVVGKLGDFAVLSDDPRKYQGGQLFEIKVAATILGGRVVFEG
jgi:predicted amidohydrolase YtcJ